MDRPAEPEQVAPGPSADEAAAIVATLEAVLRATAPAPATEVSVAEPPSPWVRAALLEGVGRADYLDAGRDDPDR